MKKMLVILLLCLLLLGCTVRDKAYNPISEEELIRYVKNTIYEKTGDKVNAEILDKRELTFCGLWIDSCFLNETIEGAYNYTIKVTNVDDPDISANTSFSDSYYSTDERIINRKYHYDEYLIASNKNKVVKEIETALENESSFHIYDEKENLYVLIQSTDYELLHELFVSLINLNINNNLNYKIYIIKDSAFYESIDFDGSFEDIPLGKWIKNSYGYSRNMMETNSIDGYSSLVFMYANNACNNQKNCSVLYGTK